MSGRNSIHSACRATRRRALCPSARYFLTMRNKLSRPKDKQATSTRTNRKTAGNERTDDEARVIDFDRYIPTVVSRLMTKLRASAQTYFDERHGITRLDWRIISFLTAKGPSSAYEIWTLGNLDKAAVSRALKVMERRKLVMIRDVPESTRRRTVVSLTRLGRELNKKTFGEIIQRHGRLIGSLTPRQIERFIETARYLESRIPFMDHDSDEPTTDYDVTRAAALGKPRGQ